jgi:hypothetical protein
MTAEEREGIERRADIARLKLSRTLQALGRKRHDVADVGLRIRRRARRVVLVAVVLAFTLGGAVAALARRRAERGVRARRERWMAIGRALLHPERVARREALAPSLLGKKVIRVVLTTVAAELAKRAAKRLLEAPKRDVAFDVPRAVRER